MSFSAYHHSTEQGANGDLDKSACFLHVSVQPAVFVETDDQCIIKEKSHSQQADSIHSVCLQEECVTRKDRDRK